MYRVRTVSSLSSNRITLAAGEGFSKELHLIDYRAGTDDASLLVCL